MAAVSVIMGLGSERIETIKTIYIVLKYIHVCYFPLNLSLERCRVVLLSFCKFS